MAGLGGCRGLFLLWLFHLGWERRRFLPPGAGRREAVEEHQQNSIVDSGSGILLLESCTGQPLALGFPQAGQALPLHRNTQNCTENPKIVTIDGRAGRGMSSSAGMYQQPDWEHWGELEQGKNSSCLPRAGCQQLPGEKEEREGERRGMQCWFSTQQSVPVGEQDAQAGGITLPCSRWDEQVFSPSQPALELCPSLLAAGRERREAAAPAGPSWEGKALAPLPLQRWVFGSDKGCCSIRGIC